jgi:hypothetical protein
VGIAKSALTYDGVWPPDTIGAAGPNYYVEGDNLQIGVYNKSNGNAVSGWPKSFATFFSPLGGVLNLSDPFVTYDTFTGKFVVGMLDYNSSNTLSRLDFAVSNTSDPTGTWTFHRYDMTNDGTGTHFADYPRFGYNQDAYVVTFNMFNGSQHVDTLAINKSTLASFVHVWPTGTVSLPGMSPTVMHDAAADGPMWFVGTGSGASIKVIKMTNVLSSSPTITPYTVSVSSYGSMPTPRQPNGSNMPWTFDTRIMNAAMNGGMLVAAHNTGISGAARARWYEFNTNGASPTLVQSGQIAPASTTDTYFPTVEINSSGTIGMTFIESSPTEYMTMYVTGRTTSDATGMMETPATNSVVTGTSRYTINRAGDYSGISLDPSSTTLFWAANEYKGSAVWNTGFMSFTVSTVSGAATHFSIAASPSSVVAGDAFDLTVTALDANNTIATSYRGTVSFTSTDPQGASLPDNYTFTAGDAGVHTFSMAAALYTAGNQSISATDISSGITGSGTVSVRAAALDHFQVDTTAANPDVAGTVFNVTVTALDPYGNRANYTGRVTFSSADPYGATLPADYTFSIFDGGRHTFANQTALYTAGTWDVTVTDINTGAGGSAFINVMAAPAAAFQVIAPSSAVSGSAFDVTIVAVDPYGNTDTTYTGTITFSTSDPDPGVVLPPDYPFQPSDAGMVTFSGGVTLVTLGNQTVQVDDFANGLTGNTVVTVTAMTAQGGANAVLARALPAQGSQSASVPTSVSTWQTATPVPVPLIPLGTDTSSPSLTSDPLTVAILDTVLEDWTTLANPLV